MGADKPNGPILNIDELTLQPRPEAYTAKKLEAALFDAKMAPIGPLLGAKKLGYNLTVMTAGKRAFPLHSHRVNKEMFFILEGIGDLRFGRTRIHSGEATTLAWPPGDVNMTHQMFNTGARDLNYLSISTRLSLEVAEYLDVGTCSVLANFSDQPGENKSLMFVGRREHSGDYWAGRSNGRRLVARVSGSTHHHPSYTRISRLNNRGAGIACWVTVDLYRNQMD